ncbi:MAG: hypothetical protein IT238_11330 [Bacteroidia bacterium]|nr:hypothetical protein [Bacteroidia bacterium]MCZ2249465.1 hypothetical protein [Bacteroidia bacterium]
MNKYLFYIFFTFIGFQAKAQLYLQQIPDRGLYEADAIYMQKGYKLAFSNMTSENYLFKGREEEWKKQWSDFLSGIYHTISEKQLWPSSVGECYFRVYFNKDGTVAACLYQMAGLDKDKEEKLKELIFNYLIKQKLKIETTENYWQYGVLKFGQ